MEDKEFTYSEVFDLNNGIVLSTKRLIKGGILNSNVPIEDRAIAMHEWMIEASSIYDVPCPDLILLTKEVAENEEEAAVFKLAYSMTGGGVYSHDPDQSIMTITMFDKVSITTFLHEFRHHLQATMPEIKVFRGDIEEDARAWSCSLYRAAAPKMYANAVAKGILHYS